MGIWVDRISEKVAQDPGGVIDDPGQALISYFRKCVLWEER